MLRRTALALMAAGLLAISCRRRPDPKERVVAAIGRRQRVVESIDSAIRAQAPDQTVTLIPALLGLLIPFLCQMLAKCLLAQVLKQHRVINRDPDGVVAQRWKSRVAGEFAKKHGDVGLSLGDVDNHVSAAFEAFREASVAELTEAVEALRDLPTEADWDAAGLVRDLVREA